MSSYKEALEKKVAESGEMVRWFITVAVSLGALLEVIDTSIVNVALPHIQGNLGATLSEVGWVVTGYAMANGIMIPLSAWLGSVFGRKGYFIFSMIGFTLASVMCGVSTNLPVLVIARILQGLFGGGLLAKAQSLIFETFPKEKQGLAQGIFGICVIVGPIMGPTLGGYITDTLDWRWIFFINIPFGILATLLCSIYLPDDVERKFEGKVDWWGIALLCATIGSFQYILEKGQDDDWFSSRTICALAVVSVVGLIGFVWRELTTRAPAVDLRVLRHRSVLGGVGYSLVMGISLFGTAFAIPSFVQNVLDYTAMQSGMLQMPGSLVSGLFMPFVGIFSSRFDARVLVGLGAFVSGCVMMNLTGLSLDTSPDSFFWPLVFRGGATVCMFLPLTLATLGACPPEEIPAASAFMNLSRQLGGSIGVAALTTLLTQRMEFHRIVLIEKVTPFNPAAVERFQMASGLFHSHGVNIQNAMQGARMLVNGQVLRQAQIMSYDDISFIVAMLMFLSLPLLFLLTSGKTSRPIAAEVH